MNGLRRVGSLLLWYGLPLLALAGVVAYVGAATVGHVNPPVVPVQGLSMRPTLQGGDLIVLRGVDPATLRKGDIVAVNTSADDRRQYGVPAEVVHRIVRVGHDAGGLFFVTKGDANTGADVFQTRPGDVVGKLRFAIPAAGYPFLFFRSRQGEIFLVVAALVALAYFLLGLVDERRAAPVAFAQSSDTMRELVAAVSEYGVHLRSHTAVMKNLAATTDELRLATARMASVAEVGDLPDVRPRRVDTARLDRLLAETAARVEETSQRRDELRRLLRDDSAST
jgi:signal peptidase I